MHVILAGNLLLCTFSLAKKAVINLP